MTGLLTYDRQGAAAHIVMDDGKANAMSPAMLSALHEAFDRAAAEGAMPVLRSGRPGVFSAGFDLKVMAGGDGAAVGRMVRMGAELALKVLSFPLPVVTATAGHAYPMGAFLMLSADWRIGAQGPWQTGFNEVLIGLTIPTFALEIGRQRLTAAIFSRTAMTGEMYGPEAALAGGFIDELVAPEALDAAIDAAVERLAGVQPGPHHATKLRARGAAIAAVRAAIDAELPAAA